MSIQFDVQIIDDPSGLESVKALAQDYSEHAEKLVQECTDEKVRKIFADNSSTMKNIYEAIDLKLDPLMSEGLTKHKIVVSYDSQHIVQAIAIIQPEYEYLPENENNIIKCSELCFLATAYWNIDCPNTKDERKVKGAGTSIVNFCRQLGKQFGSGGKIFLEAYTSSIEFYQEKLHFQIVGEKQLGITPMLLS